MATKEKFDYAKAMERLGEIVAKVEDRNTSLDDIGGLVKESSSLIRKCREYLRSVRSEIEAVEKSGEGEDEEKKPF